MAESPASLKKIAPQNDLRGYLGCAAIALTISFNISTNWLADNASHFFLDNQTLQDIHCLREFQRLLGWDLPYHLTGLFI